MASYLNKMANSVTNSTSGLIGRGNLQKLSNSINKALTKAKYREFMRSGNTIQLISKSSHMALQIMASQNDQSRLVLYGNGQVGPNFTNSQFVLEVDPKSGNYMFKNFRNYIAFDNDHVPCVLAENLNPKNKYEKMRSRNEFRLHEIIGSEEYFSLESVYTPGRYLAVTPDGSITVSKNKTDESTYFCIHVIHVLPENIRGNLQLASTNLGMPAEPNSGGLAPSAPIAAPITTPINTNSSLTPNAGSKGGEAEQHAATKASEAPSAPTDIPPNYTSLFPKLPGQ